MIFLRVRENYIFLHNKKYITFQLTFHLVTITIACQKNKKQWALWKDDHNGWTDGKKSRGLSDFADGYQTFFNAVYTGSQEDNYKNLVNAYQVDKNTDTIKEDTSDIVESVTNLDGETNLRTFEYKNAIYEVDKNNNAYVIGPYCIDYSLNDANGDVYKTTDGYELKFNSIESIKVFNQNGDNIERLGGSFKIAYKYNNGIPSGEEGKIRRINDEYYCEMANGEEISGFDSRKPFYIVIYRGTMQPAEFKGFYAKIDFRYLEHVDGTVDKYKAHVYEYYYEHKLGDKYSETLTAYIEFYNGNYGENIIEGERLRFLEPKDRLELFAKYTYI